MGLAMYAMLALVNEPPPRVINRSREGCGYEFLVN